MRKMGMKGRRADALMKSVSRLNEDGGCAA